MEIKNGIAITGSILFAQCMLWVYDSHSVHIKLQQKYIYIYIYIAWNICSKPVSYPLCLKLDINHALSSSTYISEALHYTIL